MQILINNNGEITNYAIVGGFENGIEISNIPQGFIDGFKPLKYKYENERISLNKNYSEEVNTPVQPPIVNTPNNDEELRKMFANMQVQLVQANTMVMQLSQQNAQLSQELVRINQAIDDIKEVDKDENAVSEV